MNGVGWVVGVGKLWRELIMPLERPNFPLTEMGSHQRIGSACHKRVIMTAVMRMVGGK